ncbi:pilus assembly protein PilM [Candidatus Uhrbacteria bacterium]|nr:pilus assembly protein PilM [Candidatus Uhrbacteria bacterium]
MGFFSKKPSSILGIDVGASAVKLVELVRDGARARLRTYGYTERAFEAAPSDSRERAEEMGTIIRELKKKTGAQANTAIASLPTFSVFSSIIILPELPKKEVPNAIRWEAKKLVPLPLEEMILNWEVLPDGERLVAPSPARMEKRAGDLTATPVIAGKEKKSVHYLITAAEKKLVEQYVAIFKASGLTLQSLETEAFALVRSLIGNDKSTVMIVDIGAKNTDLSIIDSGIPVLNRSMDFGGKAFTDALAQMTKLSPTIAEQLKRDLGRAPLPTMPKFLEAVFAPLVNELHYTISLYQSRSGRRIEKIIVTGGSGFLFNCASLLSSRFNITVAVGDPWARVATPVDLAPALTDIGPRMSVAVGLAMRGI